MPRHRVSGYLALVLAVCAAACGGGGGGSGSPASSPLPAPQPITVSLTPASANVFLGATLQFTATVSNTSNTAVNWSVNGVPGGNTTTGTISATGLYTAPAVLPAMTQVTVQAASQADTTKSASATVTVASDVAVSVSPSSPAVLLGATQQFTANVTGSGSPSRAVTWKVNGIDGGNPAIGLISAAGLYTAPPILPSPPGVSITATSVADPAKSGSATATVSSGNLAVSVLGPGSVDNLAQAQYTAVVTADSGAQPSTAVTWSVNGVSGGNPTVGTIDATGLYTAPLLPPTPATVTLRATSVADPGKSGALNAVINSVVVVLITPSTASVELETSQAFTATVGGTTDQRVLWDVNGIVGGDAVVGTVSNPASGPTSPTTYLAPVNKQGPAQVTVRATSLADPTKSAAATVSLFSNIAVTVSPAMAVRAVNLRQALSVSVAPTSNPSASWAVNGASGGNDTIGKICVANSIPCQQVLSPTSAAAVDYVAPAGVPAPNPVTVTATSQADPARMGSAQVSILSAVQVSVFPAGSTVPPGGTQVMASRVVGSSNQAATWSVNGIPNGDATVGGICAPGSNPCQPPPAAGASLVEYRAPSVAPAMNPVTITAASIDDPAQSASGSVNIAIGPVIQSLAPSSFTAVPTGGFTLRLMGINFVSGSMGSEILFNGAARSTTCLSVTECLTTLGSSDTMTAGDQFLQVRNPNGQLSNQVLLRVAPPETTEDVMLLSALAPDASGKDIAVVESPAIGNPSAPLNIDAIGLFSGGTCNTRASVALTRPASGTATAEICFQGDSLTSPVVRLSGPVPDDLPVSNLQPAGVGFFRFTVTLSSTTQPGARTLFVENANGEKAAATGAIEVK